MSTTLDQLAQVCRALSEAEAEVDRLEEKLAFAKEHARVLREETGPSLMQEIGVKEIKLESGEKVSYKQDVFSQIAKEDKPEIYKWLDDNKFGGLIKTSVQINFTRGDLEKAKKMYHQLISKQYDVTLVQDVHAQTMAAFLREQIAKGAKDFPLDLFKAKPIWKMKIK